MRPAMALSAFAAGILREKKKRPALGVAFKPNINLVVLDWLVRHGHVPPDAPGYLELVAGLRQGECC